MEPISAFFKEEKDILYRRGFAKGLEQAREERSKGRKVVKKEMALKMIEHGIEMSMIANITGLSIEEIEKL